MSDMRNEGMEEVYEKQNISELDEGQKFVALLYLLKRYAELGMSDAEGAMKELLPELTSLLMELFPAIIKDYEQPYMEPYKDDINYWVNQIKRIMEVVDSKDVFAQIDVLYCETYHSLLEYQKIVVSAVNQ
ncbi:MAG: hypothetical protein IKB01_00245 [Lachnospiraceae bacterium]|nr:hypothetical protein [Lachnospiraceae bacterium]